jgi:hypothetical protein
MNCEKKDCHDYNHGSKNHCLLTVNHSNHCLENGLCYYSQIENVIELKNDAGNKFDNVNKPKHYNQFQTEVIDIIKSCLTRSEYEGYLKGNLIKYRMRAGFKENRDEDLNKSNWYQDKLEGLK